MNKTQLLQSLRSQGFSKEIIKAFSKVRRENFLPKNLKQNAYEDTALPIGQGQTISQPYTIAVMLSLLELKKRQKVLEIGSGCGYVLALLSVLVGKKGEVYGIERIKELADSSRKNLMDYRNVSVHNKSGVNGLPEKKPFDRIIISAGCSKVPEKLAFQLKERGILVAPVGASHEKSIMQFKKIKNELVLKKEIHSFAFVPLIEE
jgi:protein-L-isoaspartate(D-aspartate) O-methyltransferase